VGPADVALKAFFEAYEAPDARARNDDASLKDALASSLAIGRSAWPDVEMTEARWGKALGERVPVGEPIEATVQSLNVKDIYLAVACEGGDAIALRYFETEHVPALRGVLLRLGLSQSVADETLQVLRDDLFVARPGKRLGIAGYSGRGALRGWLRAVAGRTGLRIRPDPKRNVSLTDSFAGAGVDDLELDYLKRTYAPAFQESFREALEALPQKTRLLLKQRFRHQLSIGDLGALHGVHEATISRWVTTARAELVSATREGMMRRLRVGRADVSSILRLIESKLDITLSSLDPSE
jgi:RNA polymerase sigma-70 factor (ECF subfamily)